MSIHGEGDIRIQVQKRVRIGCDNCGEPATKRISYCYVNGRSNPASSMYRRDDCTYCSDAQAWACNECKREVERVCAPDGMQWASTTTLFDQNASTFLRWEDRDSAVVAELIESARALRSAHRAFQDWKAQAPKVYPAPRSILEMNAGAKARLFAALDRVDGAA